ncbi:637_t:CDS:2 [Entrophospora sp. SA101]|nr:637_t:CDS:2 [Entrophospora sp. SA101]
MSNTDRGGTIREYIDARKKASMSWDEFRKLKTEHDGPQFSEHDLIKYRQKLDEEREARLKGFKHKHHHHDHHKDRNLKHSKHSKSTRSVSLDSQSSSKHKHKVHEEDHTGGTPVRLSEFLKHGSSSSDE